jgi:virginiamycin B lyase
MRRITAYRPSSAFFVASVAAVSMAVCLVASAAASATITEYPIPTPQSQPYGITAGPDGALWFTERPDFNADANNVGRITTSGSINEFSVPTPFSEPYGITAGPDGALWFIERNPAANKIGRITTSGSFSEFPIPTPASDPVDITAGPDGALWFTEETGNKIGRVTTSGSFSEFSVPTPNSEPFGITAGPDGALWFTEASASKIGRVTTSGSFSEFSVHGALIEITAGPDGALWFTAGENIGRITTSGSLSEFPIPTPQSSPYGITAGPDGALWFTEAQGNNIGRITTGGSFRECGIPTPGSDPLVITPGPDGALWFTEANANQIGRITTAPCAPASVVLSPADAVNNVSTTHTVTATVKDASGNPLSGITVLFKVQGADNVSGSCTTDSSGQCSFTYQGPNLPGADLITACADSNGNGSADTGEPCAEATKAWVLPTSTQGQTTGGGQILNAQATDKIAFGFSAKSDSKGVKGECTVVDPSTPTNTKIKCLDVTALVQGTTHATFFGDATVNGVATTYRIDVDDIADPGAGKDTFKIQTDSGYVAGGILTAGNIQVHN